MGEISGRFGSRTESDMKIKKKTICFLIFAVGKANGGHYRSLSMISDSLTPFFNVVIINLGYLHSPVLKSKKINNYFVFFNGFNIISSIWKIKRILKNIEIDFVHSFDHQSLLIGKIISLQKKIPLIYTKCGGSNPMGYFPKAPNIVLFSQENYDFFLKNFKYSESKFFLIPNRVEDFRSDKNKISKLINKHKLDADFIFLRICRIGKTYIKSINQSISLIKKLTKDGYNVQLLIVGNIQEQDVYSSLIASISEFTNIKIEINKEYIEDAKTIINVSDFVIGTGRGYMEASSKYKVLLTPSVNADIPVLINDENFEDAFKRNFSERIQFHKNIVDANYGEIKKILDNKNRFEIEKLKNFNRYEKYFSLKTGVFQYLNMYENVLFKNSSVIDLLRDYIYLMKLNKGNFIRHYFKR